MMYYPTILLVVLSYSFLCDGARILALFHLNSKSHFCTMEPLLLELHRRGHHITVVSSFPRNKPVDNYTEIDFSTSLPPLTSKYTLEKIRRVMPNLFKTVKHFVAIHMHSSEEVMKSERVLDLVNQKFDLVIGEIFASDSLTYIAHILKVPYISWVTSTSLPWVDVYSGLPDNPAYIPNFFVSFCSDMNIFQRAYNTFTLVYAKVMYHFLALGPSQVMAERWLNQSLPSITEFNGNTSLVLLNTHYSLSPSRPLPPNVVEVGGIHIKESKPLPEDIKEFLDGAENGAVLLSFGSIVRFCSLPPHWVRIFLKVIAVMPQRFVIKYEEDLPDAPLNVIYKSWLPQSDILAHPNVRAVISHGGQASTMEAVYHAKPLLAVPFFGDHYHNSMNVVCRGAGIFLDIDNLSERDFSKALHAILDNSWYAENMKRLSQQFRDRPMTPLETAVYWTEYVIRHQGASHLRPASVSMPLYQYLLLDVIVVLTTSLVTVIFVIYLIVQRISSRLRYLYTPKLKSKTN